MIPLSVQKPGTYLTISVLRADFCDLPPNAIRDLVDMKLKQARIAVLEEIDTYWYEGKLGLLDSSEAKYLSRNYDLDKKKDDEQPPPTP